MRQPRGALNRRAGFTLLDILVVLGFLAVVMLFSVSMLLGSLRIEQAAVRSFHRDAAHRLLADRFREDVAQAQAAPGEVWWGYRASPTCLILDMGQGRHVIYRAAGPRLERIEEHPGGKPSTLQVPLGNEMEHVSLKRDGAQRRLLTLEVIEDQPRGGSHLPLVISAALGGDRQ